MSGSHSTVMAAMQSASTFLNIALLGKLMDFSALLTMVNVARKIIALKTRPKVTKVSNIGNIISSLSPTHVASFLSY
jgi:hypothetical protein